MRALPDHSTKQQSAFGRLARIRPTVLTFAIFAAVIAAIIALRVAVWLPAFQR